MNILAIDSVSDELVVCGSCGDNIQVRTSVGNKKHNSAILPLVDEVVDALGITLQDIDFIGCVIGAGSFTGIRIGIATCKALSTALSKPCVAITSFEEMAYDSTGKFITAIDCRHDEFYTATFDGSWRNFVGFGIMTKDMLNESKDLVIYKNKPSSAEHLIGIVRAKAESGNLGTLEPLYLKKSQAEREKDGE